jgi:hypothetical protein
MVEATEVQMMMMMKSMMTPALIKKPAMPYTSRQTCRSGLRTTDKICEKSASSDDKHRLHRQYVCSSSSSAPLAAASHINSSVRFIVQVNNTRCSQHYEGSRPIYGFLFLCSLRFWHEVEADMNHLSYSRALFWVVRTFASAKDSHVFLMKQNYPVLLLIIDFIIITVFSFAGLEPPLKSEPRSQPESSSLILLSIIMFHKQASESSKINCGMFSFDRRNTVTTELKFGWNALFLPRVLRTCSIRG